MIAQLVRQDPAFRRMPMWIVAAAGWASVASGIIAWTTARGEGIGLDLAALLVWFSTAQFLVFGDIGVRASGFNMALPIPARRLWFSHIVAVSVTAVVVLVVSAAATVGSFVLVGRLAEGRQFGTPALVAMGVRLLAGLALSVAIVHMFRPSVQEVPISVRRVAWSLVAVAVPPALAVALHPLGVVDGVILLALAGAAFARVVRSAPDVFSVPAAPRRRTAPIGATTETPWAATGRRVGPWFSVLVVHRTTTCGKKPAAMLLVVPLLLFLGFWVSGVDGRWISNPPRFAYPFMIVYVLMAATTIPLNGLGAMEWLPWSRRRKLALMVLPLVALVVAGFGIGRATDGILARRAHAEELLHYVTDRDSGEARLAVRLSACRIAWSGRVPEVGSPSGETHEPWNRPVVRGLPVRVYFPWDVPAGASSDFAALQISRAARSLYGADIAPEEIRARYLDVAAGETPSLTLQSDYGLHRGGRGVYFPWIMAEVVVLWSLLTASYTRWLRGGRSMKKRTAIGGVFLAVPMVFWIADFVLDATGVSDIAARNAFVVTLSRHAGETLIGSASVWLASALVAWGAYRLVERGVDRAEFDLKPFGKSCL